MKRLIFTLAALGTIAVVNAIPAQAANECQTAQMPGYIPSYGSGLNGGGYGYGSPYGDTMPGGTFNPAPATGFGGNAGYGPAGGWAPGGGPYRNYGIPAQGYGASGYGYQPRRGAWGSSSFGNRNHGRFDSMGVQDYPSTSMPPSGDFVYPQDLNGGMMNRPSRDSRYDQGRFDQGLGQGQFQQPGYYAPSRGSFSPWRARLEEPDDYDLN